MKGSLLEQLMNDGMDYCGVVSSPQINNSKSKKKIEMVTLIQH